MEDHPLQFGESKISGRFICIFAHSRLFFLNLSNHCYEKLTKTARLIHLTHHGIDFGAAKHRKKYFNNIFVCLYAGSSCHIDGIVYHGHDHFDLYTHWEGHFSTMESHKKADYRRNVRLREKSDDYGRVDGSHRGIGCYPVDSDIHVGRDFLPGK